MSSGSSYSRRAVCAACSWIHRRAVRGAISRFVSSPDGSHVVYWISTNGSEWVETRVIRVSDGSILADSLDGLRFAERV